MLSNLNSLEKDVIYKFLINRFPVGVQHLNSTKGTLVFTLNSSGRENVCASLLQVVLFFNRLHKVGPLVVVGGTVKYGTIDYVSSDEMS